MNTEKIRQMLSLGEGPRIEFKASIQDKEAIGKAICGFLNKEGGYVLCGIQEPDIIIGVHAPEEAVRALEKDIHEAISPRAYVSFQVESIDRHSIIVIEVPKGNDVPYAFRNVFYTRDGETTRQADAATIRDIVLRHQIEPERWERRISFAELETDLDYAEIKAAIADAQKVQRAYFRDATQPHMILEDLSVAKYGRLTNAGDVLFTTNPAMRLPQVRIRAMRYNSDKAGDKFNDMKSFEGPLRVIFEEAYSFIVRNTPSPARFVKGNPKRQDAPLYPEAAVREALINALAHRDYSAASGGVSIHIFPQRLEIWNSGPLPEGVTVKSLAKGQISVLRNPDIAHVLYLRGLMEKAGRGSVLMIQQCKEAGLPPPTWESDPALGVTVTFFTPEVTPEVTTEVTTEVTPEVTTEVKKLLSCLVDEMSRHELQQAMNLKNDEHFRKSYLLPAMDSGLVEMTIPDKPNSNKQGYRLTAKGKALSLTPEVTTEATTEVTTEVKKLLSCLMDEMSRHELQRTMNLKNDEHFRKSYLLPAMDAGLIEMTIPDKPKSNKQRYRLTAKGETLRKQTSADQL